jgi:predicted nucleic acid-binding protein
MTYQADATFVIDVLAGQPVAAARYPTLLSDGMALSILTYMELWEGALMGRDPAQAARRLRQFLRPMAILPFSRRVALRAARLRGELRRLGRPVEQRALDILIAATALEYGLIMVTSDRDYDDIPGLPRLNPRDT